MWKRSYVRISLHIKSLSCNYFSGEFGSDLFLLHDTRICVLHLPPLRNSHASCMRLLIHKLHNGRHSRYHTVAASTVSNRTTEFLFLSPRKTQFRNYCYSPFSDYFLAYSTSYLTVNEELRVYFQFISFLFTTT